ncbi:DNA alkylation repair protein [Sutcliffiella horikoshii]|uniref:DNA alkylation repair protein n=1 Tax=Sutcliffiella horikoshii TaxID=79883 RepID=A0A5D4SN01_9BACI|nr:DNA alkylation repair protein [Sutcliffiella horikoshii]TYS63588.1 DNA alkylation repair protein [Sutcliffiella horikoshii]UAL49554.1 DNA alkylation repair protein [Sutcliffiella horikoshii]
MASPYLCPNCKTNRSRFNIIEQVAKSVKLNPQSGEVVEEYTSGTTDPFHIPYKGPSQKIQCATCGNVDEEITFIKHAEYQKG